jgi:hypothetical protein
MDMYTVIYKILRFVFDKAFLATWFIVTKIYIPAVLTTNILVPFVCFHARGVWTPRRHGLGPSRHLSGLKPLLAVLYVVCSFLLTAFFEKDGGLLGMVDDGFFSFGKGRRNLPRRYRTIC